MYNEEEGVVLLLYLFLGSIVLIVIGSFLPWASMGVFSVSGIEGDGIVTLLLAVVAVVVYFALKKKPTVVSVVVAIIGVLSLIITIISYYNLGELELASPGGGLIMATIGSIALIVSGILNPR